MLQQKKTIIQILNYAKSLIGTPYVLWQPQQSQDYFYCDNKLSVQQIRQKGINCAGLTNLIRKFSGLQIPPSINQIDVRGGTVFWYQYFNKNKLLTQFDYQIDYPIGTLFLRKYRDVQDQGHLAILYSKNQQKPDKLLYANIIHAYLDATVEVTILGYSHFWDYQNPLGYYQYAIYPQNWLNV